MVTDDELRVYNKMQGELEQEKERTRQMSQGIQTQMNLFNSEQQVNLIRWQLDLNEDLERIYHLLRGDDVREDSEGNIIHVEQTNKDLRPFNDFGVKILMNIMSFYLCRNTILSNYDEETINWKILDFGNELADLIHNRYEEMGMDTPDKIKMYPMIIKELVDTIHSAYLRAYHGGERESLRTARTVTQNEPLSFGGYNQSQFSQQKRKRWYNPMTWTA